MTARSSRQQQLGFQRLLDDRFPRGGLCATFVERDGRLRPTWVELVTGRLVCTAAKRAEVEGWWYRVVIDGRHLVDEDVTPLVVWIDDVARHPDVPDLWEARIESAGDQGWLRIHADPHEPWQPTEAMRRAVTEAYQADLPIATPPRSEIPAEKRSRSVRAPVRRERKDSMAIGVILEFEGATLDQYDQIIAKMGFTPGGPGGPGGLFHWVTATDTGLRVTDVWQSREDFEKFADEQINPFAQAVGLPNPPSITLQDVHNYLTAG